jgi:hypothetical protein
MGSKRSLLSPEQGGFTRAVHRLHRSQHAISHSLDILEHELGAPLFERLRGRALLTVAGRAFLPHAEAVALRYPFRRWMAVIGILVHIIGMSSVMRAPWRISSRTQLAEFVIFRIGEYTCGSDVTEG